MKIELDHFDIEQHLNLTRTLLSKIKAALPQEKDDVLKYKHSLSKVYIDEDGTLTAEYSRYEGCGRYSTFTEYPDLSKLD